MTSSGSVAPGDAARLVELSAEIRVCTACRLSETRTNAVPGDGPVTARIMAVGEAPGQTEDETGRPFVGAAGRLLTQLLMSIGLERHSIFISNVLKCRPPQNRDPLPDEVAACAPHLDAQVRLIQPDVILLLGRHALARLLPGRPPISRSHGERIRDGDRVYVPLYHPAAALYNGAMLATLESDMQRVRGYLAEAAAAKTVAGQDMRSGRAPDDPPTVPASGVAAEAAWTVAGQDVSSGRAPDDPAAVPATVVGAAADLPRAPAAPEGSAPPAAEPAPPRAQLSLFGAVPPV